MLTASPDRLLLPLLILAISSIGLSQTHGAPQSSRESLKKTADVSCMDRQGRIQGPQKVRSPVLVSPDQRYRAYVEVESLGPPLVGGTFDVAGPGCRNTTSLFILEPGQEDYHLAFLQPPLRWKLGNGIELGDWSPNGRYLLMSLILWQFESDWSSASILLYDTKYRIFIKPEHDWIFSQHFGKNCQVEISARGFSADQAIPIVEAWNRPEELATEKPCLEKKGFWLFDSYRKKISPLPDDYEVKHYGKVEQHHSEK